MNILLLGSGGREHAIAWALVKSPRTDALYVAPGNGGTGSIATNVANLDINDGAAVAAFAKANDVSLVVIGPEAPLVNGVADIVRAAGVDVFGPDSQNAQLEGSKQFSKEFMQRIGIPTARFSTFSELEPALAYVHELGAPIVVKANGLAAGKGVTVAETVEEAEEAVRQCLAGAFGAAGATVLIEECLEGPECSLLAFVTGGKAFCMATAQDHKRAFDGDRGPNTGGMGVYSPVPLVTEVDFDAMHDVMDKAAAATAEAPFDQDYRGVLYGGFMLTDQGPQVLEFNARFGDPETQVILPRLKSDLVDIMVAVAQGRPDEVSLEWSDQWAVSVVLASEGYPGSYEKGKVILGISDAEQLEDVIVFHAGTKINSDGEVITSGGRVLNVVALAKTFEEARERAYLACDMISFEGKQYRRDIGKRAAEYLEQE